MADMSNNKVSSKIDSYLGVPKLGIPKPNKIMVKEGKISSDEVEAILDVLDNDILGEKFSTTIYNALTQNITAKEITSLIDELKTSIKSATREVFDSFGIGVVEEGINKNKPKQKRTS